MNKTKVAILKNPFSKTHSLEKYEKSIAKAFRDKNAEVHIIAEEKYEKPLHFTVHYCKLPTLFSYRKIEAFDSFCAKVIARENFDIIFGMGRTRFQTHIRAGNGSHATYLTERKKRQLPLKTWLSSCNPLHHKILSIEQTAFEHPHLKTVFTSSHMVKEEIAATYKVEKNKIHVIHNGVEWKDMGRSFFHWPEIKESVGKQLGINTKKHQFLFIGNNYFSKGLIELLDALSNLPHKNFHLTVIGKEKNLLFFQRKAEMLGLAKQISFLGYIANPLPFYALADTLVIPSHYTPFANVTVEALAMGLFVLSSSKNGAKEILHPNTGIIFDAMNRISIKKSLEEAFDYPKTKASSEKIRSSVEHLDFSNQLEQLILPCING